MHWAVILGMHEHHHSLILSGFSIAGVCGTALSSWIGLKMDMTVRKVAMLLSMTFIGGSVTMWLGAEFAFHFGFYSAWAVVCGSFVFFGMFRPWMSMLKGSLVPEEDRTTVYGVYDMFQNLVVIVAVLSSDTKYVLLRIAAILVGGFLCMMAMTGAAKQDANEEVGYDGTSRRRNKEEMLFSSTSKAV
mmetsp:Transcript_31920/g.71867  ORF Transcript_31920/g.71867 Transcript_31920/m.71867 type:complete len:188 (-) Transcript_31920:13-576(-)